MKRVYLLAFLLVFLVGCASLNPLNWFLPSDKNKKAQEKIAKIEDKIDTAKEKELESARGYIYGNQRALASDPEPSKYSLLAYDLGSKGLVALGNPTMEEVKRMDSIVAGMLATNESIKASARKLLDAKDLELIKLQKKEEALEAQLEKKETDLKELATKNASLADFKVKLFRYIWFFIYFIIGSFIFRTVSHCLPPPYNGIGFIFDGVAGLFGKTAMKILPKTADFAGVVSKEVFHTSETALKNLVLSIEEIRKNKPEVFVEHMETILKDKTDFQTRAKILDVKKELGKI